MDEFRIVTAPVADRRRSRHGFGLTVTRTVFFLATLIPTCIIAWRIDLLNSRVPQQVLVQQQQPQEQPKQQQLAVPHSEPQPLRSEPSRQAQQPVTSDKQQDAAQLAKITPLPTPPKLELAPEREPLPSQTIRLKLKSKTQRPEITLKGVFKIARVDGCPYTLNPKSGQPPVDVTLKGPRDVTLSISVVDNKLNIVPTVKDDAGNLIPFTVKEIDNRLRLLKKNGNQAKNTLNNMRAKFALLKVMIEGGGQIAYLDLKAAQVQYKQLEVSIPAQEEKLAALELQFKPTHALAQFAHQLDGKCTIVLEGLDDTSLKGNVSRPTTSHSRD